MTDECINNYVGYIIVKFFLFILTNERGGQFVTRV